MQGWDLGWKNRSWLLEVEVKAGNCIWAIELCISLLPGDVLQQRAINDADCRRLFSRAGVVARL